LGENKNQNTCFPGKEANSATSGIHWGMKSQVIIFPMCSFYSEIISLFPITKRILMATMNPRQSWITSIQNKQQ
jgi:hypothetical protein